MWDSVSGSERSLHSGAAIDGCKGAGGCGSHFRRALVVDIGVFAQEGRIDGVIAQQRVGQSGIFTENPLQRRETGAVVVTVPRLDTERSQSEPFTPVNWCGLPARDFELLLPKPACTFCPAILPGRLPVSGQDGNAIGLGLLGKVAFKFKPGSSTKMSGRP